MATLYVTEFSHAGADGRSQMTMAGAVPPVVEQTVAIPGVSNQYSPETRFILVNSDTTCFLSFGNNPSPQNSTHRLPANVDRYYTVNNTDKIAVSGP